MEGVAINGLSFDTAYARTDRASITHLDLVDSLELVLEHVMEEGLEL